MDESPKQRCGVEGRADALFLRLNSHLPQSLLSRSLALSHESFY